MSKSPSGLNTTMKNSIEDRDFWSQLQTFPPWMQNSYKHWMKKKEKYDDLLECILSEQLSAQQIQEEFKADPQFEYYYKFKRGLLPKEE